MKIFRHIWVIVIIIFYIPLTAFSQRYLSDLDSSIFLKDTLRPFIKRFDNLHFTGYIQPQFQVIQSKGASTFGGGDFSPFSNSRFMLRRARIKIDYFIPSLDGYPKALFTFQVDATERGVNVRDMFLKLYETKRHLLSLTAGLFARPFGYELNLSSAYRESPERGRMSQILMPTERDLGAMISYETQNRNVKHHILKIDAGIFNGPGLSGTTDFDSHKDVISRITIKPIRIKQFEISGGLSLLYGGWRQGSKYKYEMGSSSNYDRIFVVDSSTNNIGKIAPRHYYGGDVQLVLHHQWGTTELRGEYWEGTQPGITNSSMNPGSLPAINGTPLPTYIRKFDGVFLYFLQSIINHKHEILLKYDWYDPNTTVKQSEIGKPGTNLSSADIKYSTLGIGYIHYLNDNIKLVLYYELVKNENTQFPAYSSDLKDNLFTCRLQYRF